jgi:hypothetical protein
VGVALGWDGPPCCLLDCCEAPAPSKRRALRACPPRQLRMPPTPSPGERTADDGADEGRVAGAVHERELQCVVRQVV